MIIIPTTYIRPRQTEATAIGERNRRRWSRLLSKTLFDLVPATEFNATGEHALSGARRFPGEARPSWVSIRIRSDQMAAIELLQRRHLRATGKEISRGEALAALMAAGFGTVIDHPEFGGKCHSGDLRNEETDRLASLAAERAKARS